MPTIVDSLVVLLSLDPTQFTAGQKAALTSLGKTREEAGRTAKDIEASGRKAAEGMAGLRREILSVGFALLGAAGVKEFVTNTIQTDASVTRLSHSLGIMPEKLGVWRKAVELSGGSADAFTGTVAGLISEFQKISLTGESGIIPYLRAFNVQLKFARDGTIDWADLLFKLADAAKGMSPARASTMLAGMGIDPGTIQLIIQGRKALQDYYDQAQKMSGITAANAEEAEKTAKAWREVALAFEGLGRAATTFVEPGLHAMAEGLKELTGIIRGGGGFAPGAFNFIEPGSPLDSLLKMFGSTEAFRKGGAAEPPASFADRFSAGAGSIAPLAGGDTVGIAAIKKMLESEGFRVTSTTGGAHVGRAHGAGLAIDVVAPGGDNTRAADRLRARMAQMGVQGRVIDATTPDSSAWTGPHVHVEFGGAGDMARFAAGGGAAARGPAGSTSSTQVNINTINVTTSEATAPGIAKDIGQAVKQHSFATQSNSGPN